jgi:hypothetical protein
MRGTGLKQDEEDEARKQAAGRHRKRLDVRASSVERADACGNRARPIRGNA